MRHVPFRTIAMQLYADLADEAIRRGVVTGLGLDWTTASGEDGGIHRHLLRLSRVSVRGAILLDDSINQDAEPFNMPWGVIERSVNVVDDGFWLVGSVEKLSFDIAGPWKGSEPS